MKIKEKKKEEEEELEVSFDDCFSEFLLFEKKKRLSAEEQSPKNRDDWRYVHMYTRVYHHVPPTQ